MSSDNHPFELGKSRIEALSDGIFAIAMTVLVLELHVPQLPPNSSNLVVVPALMKLLPKLAAYAVSFISLGVFWVGHHNMYHAIRRTDRTLLCFNIFFFMFVSLLPFSTSILDAFRMTQIAPMVFGANLTTIGWILYFQWIYANRQGHMIADFVTPEHRDLVRSRFLIYPVVATLTLLVCFWSIEISLLIYLALLPIYMIPGGAKSHPSRFPAGESASGIAEPRVRKWNAAVKSVVVIIAVIVLGAAWAAFRPELLFVNRKVNEARPGVLNKRSAARPVLLAEGRFRGIAHKTSGIAGIHLIDGKKVLRLSEFMTSNGPDVHVLLVAANDAGDNATVQKVGFIDVGSIKGNQGDQNYDVPAGADLGRYRAVTIWCARFHVNFGTAPLKWNQNSSSVMVRRHGDSVQSSASVK